MIEKILEILRSELDEVTLIKAKELLESELSSDSFMLELDGYMSNVVNEKNKELTEEKKERNKYILSSIMLGLGRNRTIKLLKDYKINRTVFEKVRDAVGANSSERKKKNEKAITALKFETKARAKRLKILSKVDWENIKKEYINGESPINLGKKYNISGHYITLQLKEEKVFDETRSTLIKKEIADKNFDKIDDEYIIKLVKDNPLDSKHILWQKAKNKYPWILRHQMYSKLEELGLEKTEDEVNAIRRIKSKTETNDSYMIKVNGYKAAKEVFGSIDNLVKLYMNNKLGSFNKIADRINNEISLDYEISPKQVSKIITGHSSYERNKSLGQQQLYEFIKNTLKDYEIKEEHSWSEESVNKQIDVYIPELKVGLEFNGEYWHSDAVIEYNYGKKAYEFHKERADELKKIGIKLVYVWENDWNENYKEVETAIKNKNWSAPILNKYENFVKRSGIFVSPDKKPSLLRNQIMRFLKENKIAYKKKNNSHIIELNDYNIVINVPNYTVLSNKKETLNLQKEYEQRGIELLTFLPWRNIFKIKQFLSYRLQLKSIKKIPARKCKIVSNDKITKEQREFFANNHLLGYNNFRNIEKTITLEYNGKTVIAALFTNKSGSSKTELKRLVSAYGVSVQGGASRLIKEYIRQTPDIQEIITFSDCDLGFGRVYSSIGFTQIERSKQQLTWYNEEADMKFSNISLVQVGADRLLRNIPNYVEVGIGDNLPSNQDIVKSYGFIPIYDSGYKKWSLKVNN